jgi:hypothetical protein
MRPRDTRPTLKIVPRDQETEVPRDATVLVAAPRRVDQNSTASVRVMNESGHIDGVVQLSSDGRILFWTPRAALDPQSAHRVTVSGMRDERGAPFDDHTSTFVTAGFSYVDLQVLAE